MRPSRLNPGISHHINQSLNYIQQSRHENRRRNADSDHLKFVIMQKYIEIYMKIQQNVEMLMDCLLSRLLTSSVDKQPVNMILREKFIQ